MRSILCAFFIAAAAPALAQTDGGGAAGNVEVRRVMLATGGLAQIEGEMTAPASTMRIAVERNQVADVLRTLVITGEGGVSAVELPAAEPVGPRSRTGRLLEEDLSDPVALLSALIGEEVAIAGGARSLSGRLLSVTPATLPGSDEVPERDIIRVSVIDADGRVAYAAFNAADPLSLTGEAVDAAMAELAPALAAQVDEGRRLLDVRLSGEGTAGFSFVVPTTVWRPSYRALVSGEDVTLQGWATLENTSGLDWNDVALELAVGTPVAFAQDVYSPLRTTRPDAPFEVGRTVETDVLPPSPPLMAAEMGRAGDMASALAAPAPMRQRRAMAEAPPAALVTGGPAEAGTASTVYDVAGTVSLDAGRTLTVPFLERDGVMARIAFLDLDARGPATDALEASFDADATLPGGLIAVFDEGRFVGDARFGGADGGEAAILPFAISADVDATVRDTSRRLFQNAEITGGALIVRRAFERTITLEVEAASPVTLVADLSQNPDESVRAEPDNVSVARLSPSRTRLRADLSEGATTLSLTATRPILERYLVGEIPDGIVRELLSLGGEIDAATREELARLAQAARRVAELSRQMEAIEADVAALERAVAADRANLEAIDVATPEGAAVRRRIVERTNEIDTLLTRLRGLREERLAAESALR